MLEDSKKIPTGSVAPAERRKSPRYPCTATAEIIDTLSGARINARTTDISPSGCFVDTINPLPEGTLLKICLTKENKSFVAEAKVVYAMMGMGMGLVFTSAEPDQVRMVEKWIAELSGVSQSEPEKLWQAAQDASEKNSKNEQHYVLYELILSLMRKGVLTDAEGKAMLQKLL